jgi:hypothetical protein
MLDVVQPALDGGNTHAIAHGKLLDSLYLLLIGIPQILLAHIRPRPELVAAFLTFVQLYALAYTIPFRVRTAAHMTSHFEHANLAFLTP